MKHAAPVILMLLVVSGAAYAPPSSAPATRAETPATRPSSDETPPTSSTSPATTDDPLATRPYRLRLRIVEREVSDDAGMAQVEVNLGPKAAKDFADVLIVDAKGYERPWYLRSSNASGDGRIVFETLKGTYDYTLLFGGGAATRPNYPKNWSIGREIIDDFLPKRAYIHGLWSWVKTTKLTGEYAHTNPVTDGFNYHGVSVMRGFYLNERSVLNQYVMIDPDDPPEQIVLRMVYEGRPGANSWDPKHYVNCYWGKRRIKDIGGSNTQTVRIGDLPKPGKWTRLSVSMRKDLLSKVTFNWRGGGLPDLFGLEFCTDKGRAWWDLTTLGNVPAKVEIVGVDRATPAVGATFVHQRLHTFALGKTGRVLNEIRFIPTAGVDTRCRWDFGDGATSDETRPTHVFEGKADTAGKSDVSVVVDDGVKPIKAESEVTVRQTSSQVLDFAIDLVSCPFIVRADDKALFNLHVEGHLQGSMPLTVQALLEDAAGAEIARERAPVTMFPGKKHPTFQAFSLDVHAKDLARITFRLFLRGRLLTERSVVVVSSRAALSKLKLQGDRYVDAFGRPALIRCELAEAPGGVAPRERRGMPQRVLVVGRLPAGKTPFEDRLRDALVHADPHAADAHVARTGVASLPGWSMPFRQALAVDKAGITADTEVVLIASATEMMLAGVPARAAADSISVCVDQVRRTARAEIFILTPTLTADLEDLSRQYAVALRMLGIEKNVKVIDVYSRSLQLAGQRADRLHAERVVDGRLTHRIHPDVLDMIVATVIRRFATPRRVIVTSP